MVYFFPTLFSFPQFPTDEKRLGQDWKNSHLEFSAKKMLMGQLTYFKNISSSVCDCCEAQEEAMR